MASAIYPKAKERFLKAEINLNTDTIKAALIDLADYSYSASHEFLSSASSAIVGTPVTLTSKTFTNGVFDAADATFATVTGDQSEACIIFKDTGDPATSPVIAFIDSGSGLPITPNGSNITGTWNASGIFAL